MSAPTWDSQPGLPPATPTNVRTYGRTENLQDQGDNLTPRNAHEKRPIRSRCDTHGVSLPCAGCRADELVNPTPSDEDYTDAKMRAAGGDR